MAISRHVWMILGSTERVKSRRFRTVRVVVSSLSTVARSMGASPLHHAQARAGLAVDTAPRVWQHSTRKSAGAQSRGRTSTIDIATMIGVTHPTTSEVQIFE